MRTNLKQVAFAKTRLAPTPSGYLHLGNVFSFVLTAALAQKTAAKLLLRIDDYDKERVTEKYVQDVFDTLQFLQMPWDEGPRNTAAFAAHYAQQHRMHLYREALQQLMDGGNVFACTCSRAGIAAKSKDGSYPGTCLHKKLPFDTPNSALRLHTPDEVNINVPMLTGLQTVHSLPAPVRHFVVRKKDGMPSYQLCSLIDDVHFGVDLIVRGQDLWPSTLAQLYLSQVLQKETFQKTAFVHHALMLEGGRKMSKSEGATSVFQLRKEGKTPADVFNAIAQMLLIKKPVDSWPSLAAEIENFHLPH